jgi:hypothetical protein
MSCPRLIAAIPALFMLVVALGILLGTSGLRFWDGFTPGPRFFPGWLAGLGVVLALGLLITQSRGTDAAEMELPTLRGVIVVGKTMAGLVALALLAQPLGMVPALALFALFMLLGVLRAPLLPSLLTTTIIAGGIEGIFVRWLAVPLPAPAFF